MVLSHLFSFLVEGKKTVHFLCGLNTNFIVYKKGNKYIKSYLKKMQNKEIHSTKHQSSYSYVVSSSSVSLALSSSSEPLIILSSPLNQCQSERIPFLLSFSPYTNLPIVIRVGLRGGEESCSDISG